MKLKCLFENVDMGDEIIAVPVGEGAGRIQGVLKLNREGREIVELLAEDTSEQEIVDRLSAKYDTDVQTLAGYVHNTISTLRAEGLIEE